MTPMPRLTLHEEILLLALTDREGTIFSGTHYTFALGGALLAELLLRERIEVEESRKNKMIQVKDPAPAGEPLLDECLERIRSAKKRGSVQTWLKRFASIKKLKHRIAEKLCRQGILREEEGKILILFKRKIYPAIDPMPERALVERLRAAIFTDTQEIAPRTVILVSLANSAGLLSKTFEKNELKKRKDRIEKIVNGEIMGKAAKEAIAAMQAAVMIAIMSSVVATTTTTETH